MRTQAGGPQWQIWGEQFERRRLQIVGDCNVASVEEGALITQAADRQFWVEVESGKGMVDATAKVKEMVDDNIKNENFVILDAGLNFMPTGRSRNL